MNNWRHQREAEAIRLAMKLKDKCAALFELPAMIYAESKKNDVTARRPYRLSFDFCRATVSALIECGRL